MNCSKFLNELMMKFGRSVKLNKKYFSSVLIAFGVQILFGINLVNAMLCEKEIEQQWANSHTYGDGGKEYYGISTYYTSEKNLEQVKKDYIENSKWLTSPDEQNPTKQGWQRMNGDKYNSCKEFAIGLLNKAIANNRPGNACVAKYIIDNNCKNINLSNPRGNLSQHNNSDNSSSNQSSSSGSSSQSNNKANRQATASQSNQTSSNQTKPDPMGEMGDILGGVTQTQTSSNSNDLSKMSSNQLIDIATDAENRGDYARAYLAELQLSKDPDPRISRQGMRQVSFRLRTGQGVTINRSESHRLAIQAASLGDSTAHSYVCADYINGKGVEENHRKALDYCLFAAEKGDMKAQNNLGWIYQNGEGVQHSPKLSDEWTCKAAAQGEPTAVNNVKKAKISCN